MSEDTGGQASTPAPSVLDIVRQAAVAERSVAAGGTLEACEQGAVGPATREENTSPSVLSFGNARSSGSNVGVAAGRCDDRPWQLGI